jgi:hypothetical protein
LAQKPPCPLQEAPACGAHRKTERASLPRQARRYGKETDTPPERLPPLKPVAIGVTPLKEVAPSDRAESHSPSPALELDLDLDEYGPHVDMLTEPSPVQLERRGVTSHQLNRRKASAKGQQQGSLFSTGLLWKDSIVAKLREIGCGQLASELQNCHSQKIYITCDGCKSKLTVWNRCDKFYCPCCTPRLANERREAIEWWTKSVSQPKHVVLTQRNSTSLQWTDVKQIKQSFSRLRRSKFARKKSFYWFDKEAESITPLRKWKEPTETGRTITSQPWVGGFYSLEVTNEKRGWHLHIHALVNSNYIDERVLSYEWEKATQGRGYIVKVKDCRDKSYLQEVTKYAVKGSELASWSGLDIVKFIDAFKRQRTFGVFGSLYGKRTEWREWLETNKAKRSRCECGCNSFTVTGEREWEFVTANLVPDVMKSLPPPPNGCQLVMKFNVINFVNGAGVR